MWRGAGVELGGQGGQGAWWAGGAREQSGQGAGVVGGIGT